MKHWQAGFTLIEVMIAVTVFAVVAATISQTSSQSVSNLLYLQNKTLASFVAENHLVNVRLKGLPSIGQSSERVKMAEREWQVTTKTESTQLPEMRRITVSVAEAKDKETSLFTLITVMGAH